jgi:hypothetical protein
MSFARIALAGLFKGVSKPLGPTMGEVAAFPPAITVAAFACRSVSAEISAAWCKGCITEAHGSILHPAQWPPWLSS